MIKLDRDYNSVGIISAGSGLYVYDDALKKFVFLIATSDMPAGAGAPDTIENPLLSVSRNGQVEGKQTVDQKEFTFNWNRDNLRRLEKYAGKPLRFLERDGMEFTGSMYNGTLSFDKDAYADNAIMQGKFWVTVTEDLGFVDDIRDIYALTAVITSPLPAITIEGTNNVKLSLATSPKATITVKSETTSVCTATITNNELTVTGVAEGHAIVALTCSAEGEASSERTFMVTVVNAS